MSRTLLSRIAARPRLASLILCLALAIPLAQFGAMVHALSHHGTGTPSSTGEHRHLPQAGCDSCVGYSALGGAPPFSPAPPAPPQARFAQLAVRACVCSPSPLVLAYAPRGPPSLLA